MATDAADDFDVDPRARDTARDQRRRRARVRRVDFERVPGRGRRSRRHARSPRLRRVRVPSTSRHTRRISAFFCAATRLVEAFAFDRDGDVAGCQRDPARLRIFARFERIFVRTREQPIPETSAAGLYCCRPRRVKARSRFARP